MFRSKFFVLVSLLLSLYACRRDAIVLSDKGARLQFSNDTVLFDTVFTQMGSVTKSLVVRNPYNRTLIISEIRLGGGNNGYRLNIDGIKGNVAKEIEIAPNDSIYIFVAVTINPLQANAPLVVSDSLLFTTNGNQQKVLLVAWGQDAHYITPNSKIGYIDYSIVAQTATTVTWTNDKPYVIYGYAVIDSAAQLNIDAGCKIHFFKNSGLWVYRGGKLMVNGNLSAQVIFQGTRLEADYKDLNGQWDRIWINEGASSEIRFAVIKNAFIGIQCETLFGRYAPDQTGLILENTIIKNMSGAGILSRYYKIYGRNNLIYNCGGYNLALTFGGTYRFTQCTFANYWSTPSRKTPCVYFNNKQAPLDTCLFRNCIVFGNNESEFEYEELGGGSLQFGVENSVIKIKDSFLSGVSTQFINCTINPSLSGNSASLFKDIEKENYEPAEDSPAIGRGNYNYILNWPTDLKGDAWLNPPSAGCYEY
ncbi:MAG: hypothetical protein ACK5JC_03285 [Bacteroidota bacterium]|jgi:hypothetical protein